MNSWFSEKLPSGKHTKSYWKWPFIVDLPIKHGDVPIVMLVYQRVLVYVPYLLKHIHGESSASLWYCKPIWKSVEPFATANVMEQGEQMSLYHNPICSMVLIFSFYINRTCSWGIFGKCSVEFEINDGQSDKKRDQWWSANNLLGNYWCIYVGVS